MPNQRRPGPGVDAQGQPVTDPTVNVLQLVESAIQRQDDLRAADAKLAEVRATHAAELRVAEAQRIDAIRAVDVGNVQRAAEVQATQAATLAATVVASAEALRTQVAATATAGTVALSAALEPIIRDIADLRKSQYETAGQKTQVIETRGNTVANINVIIGMVGLVLTVAIAFIGIYFSTH